jgi:hypothetical protein
MVRQRVRRTIAHPDRGAKKMSVEKATQIVGYSPLLYKRKKFNENKLFRGPL